MVVFEQVGGLGAMNLDPIYNAQGSAAQNVRLQTTPVMRTFQVVAPPPKQEVNQDYGRQDYYPPVDAAPVWPWVVGGLAVVGVGAFLFLRRR